MDSEKVKVLRSLLNSRGRHRARLFKRHDNQKIIREVCINVLRGNIPLSNIQQKKLKKHAPSIRKLAIKRTSMKHRYKLTQQGGFLPLLIKPLLGMLASSVVGAVTSQLAKR